MSLELVITAYLVPLAGLLFLLAMLRINPLFDKRQTAFLKAAVWVNILLIAATSLDYVFAGMRVENIWIGRRITSFLNFAAAPLIPILLLEIYNQKKTKAWLYLPALANAVICFISVFVKLVFFISERNKYSRGALFFIPFAITLFYLALLMFNPVRYHIQSKKNERLFLVAVIALLLVSMYLEIEGGLRFLNWGCSALGLIFYYLLINIHGYILDPLTGVYNRIMYNRSLDRIQGTADCTLALMDLNGLKQINDSQGHDAGDRILTTFVFHINRQLEKAATLYRIGGDEFVLLSQKAEPAELEAGLEAAARSLAEENISFAYGFVFCKATDSLPEALKTMDERMYAHKNSMKPKAPPL